MELEARGPVTSGSRLSRFTQEGGSEFALQNAGHRMKIRRMLANGELLGCLGQRSQ